jgi:translation initiation factor 1A
MGKNTKGGKHHKKHKRNRNQDEGGKIAYANEDQVYAAVLKKVGGKRIWIVCSDTKERSGLIPGKFFKRVWMNVGDVLLCELNKGDDSQCYIIHKYSNKDANLLKSQGKITFTVNNEDDEDVGYDFEGMDDGNDNKPSNGMLDIKNIKNITSNKYIDYPDSDSDDSYGIQPNTNKSAASTAIKSKKWSAKKAAEAKVVRDKANAKKKEEDSDEEYKNVTIDDL